MTQGGDSDGGAARGWLSASLRGLWVALRSLLQFLLIAWAALAIHFSNLPWTWLRLFLCVAFAAFGAWALWLTPRAGGLRRRMGWAFAAAFLAVAAWFVSIRPSHDRPWRPDVSVMPRALFQDDAGGGGDRVRISGVRHFDYRTRDDFTIRYESRDISLSRVASVDLLLSYWKSRAFSHTFLSFNFDDGSPPLCVSIEVRPEVGERFAVLPAMFKQFELIFVVGDERDLIGVRAAHRSEQVFLYPIKCAPDAARKLLRVYLDRINALADRPEFYHALKNNCTTNIVRYADAAGRRSDFDRRHYLNGLADRCLYDNGWVDTSVPFDELRRRADVTAAARAAIAEPDFSKRIRAGR